MTGPHPRSERAIRAALTDRLKAEGRRSGRELQDVRRQFVLRRFLTRVFADQPDQWILKGGTAMVLRLPNARPSKDLDLLRRDGIGGGLRADILARAEEADPARRRAAIREKLDEIAATVAAISLAAAPEGSNLSRLADDARSDPGTISGTLARRLVSDPRGA